MPRPITQRAELGLRHTRRSTVYFLLGLVVVAVLPSVWAALGLVPAVIALREQVRAFRAFSVVRSGGLLQLLSVLSMLGCLLLGLLAAAPLVQRTGDPDYRRCMEGANTGAAREACDQRFSPGPGMELFRRAR